MKFIHTSDLHIGKKLCECSLLNEQKFMLNQIINICEQEKTDLLIIAGDIYDKSIPSAEAVGLFNYFITSLNQLNIKVAMISGNHDSAERISFGNILLRESNLFVSSIYNGIIENFTLKDEYGDITIWLMPFLRPSSVKNYTENEITNYTQAIKESVNIEKIDFTKRNILVSHQFVTGSSLSESEDIIVGGLDNVDCTAYEGFDYVALGHIHKYQQISDKNMYYSGTPMKYSFSECSHIKSLIVGEICEKGNINISNIEIPFAKDIKKLKGKFEELIDNDVSEDYYHIILTDEDEILSAVDKLRRKYPNILSLEYENTRTKATGVSDYTLKTKDPFTLFSEFYMAQNATTLSNVQEEYIKDIIQEVINK